MRIELVAVYNLLSIVKPGNPFTVSKHEVPQGNQQALEELWEVVEICRLLVCVPERWKANFSSRLANLLTPRERLGLIGQAEKTMSLAVTPPWRGREPQTGPTILETFA